MQNAAEEWSTRRVEEHKLQHAADEDKENRPKENLVTLERISAELALERKENKQLREQLRLTGEAVAIVRVNSMLPPQAI